MLMIGRMGSGCLYLYPTRCVFAAQSFMVGMMGWGGWLMVWGWEWCWGLSLQMSLADENWDRLYALVTTERVRRRFHTCQNEMFRLVYRERKLKNVNERGEMSRKKNLEYK
ncbi:hypothetical protein A9Q96_08285 [Rhodobacterales bacterium 52_120_T64]|nr:hypothetical protein A9Q96_08285 [Rhodobacterales bacterium 52_120_T64]